MNSNVTPLKPARPDATPLADEDYMPRVRWKVWGGLLLALLGMAGAYLYTKERALSEERRALLEYYGKNAQAAVAPFGKMKSTAEKLVLDALAKAGPAERFVQEGLNLEALYKAPGLYLRIGREASAQDVAALADATAAIPTDGVVSCLGASAKGAKDLFVRSVILDPSYTSRITEATDHHVLQAIELDMKKKIGRDVPDLVAMTGTQWLLLVKEVSANSEQSVFDVYLWDLPRSRLVLSNRVVTEGMMIPALNAVGGKAVGPRVQIDAQGSRAIDCAVASEIRQTALPTP